MSRDIDGGRGGVNRRSCRGGGLYGRTGDGGWERSTSMRSAAGAGANSTGGCAGASGAGAGSTSMRSTAGAGANSTGGCAGASGAGELAGCAGASGAGELAGCAGASGAGELAGWPGKSSGAGELAGCAGGTLVRVSSPGGELAGAGAGASGASELAGTGAGASGAGELAGTGAGASGAGCAEASRGVELAASWRAVSWLSWMRRYSSMLMTTCDERAAAKILSLSSSAWAWMLMGRQCLPSPALKKWMKKSSGLRMCEAPASARIVSIAQRKWMTKITS